MVLTPSYDRRAKNTQCVQLPRFLTQTHITTFGENAAVATTEFHRPGQPPGRQSQTWIRFPEGWRIVSAHISLLDEGPA